MADVTLEALLEEGRTFPPPPDFVAGALVGETTSDRADADPEAFWAEQVRALLDWDTDFDTTCEWDLPFAKWFVGGRLNVSYNCLDRHVAAGHGDQVAHPLGGRTGRPRSIAYAELLADVCRTANAVKELGVQRGDRVAIYMGMVRELAVAMLACARIGAAHSVVFGGFTADSLRDRVDARGARPHHWRRCLAARRDRPPQADRRRSARRDPVDRKVLVLERTAQGVPMTEGRDVWWHEVVPGQSGMPPPSRWTRRTCSSSSTRAGRPGSPRASCTRPAGT